MFPVKVDRATIAAIIRITRVGKRYRSTDLPFSWYEISRQKRVTKT
jgi:hypothetical protein